MRRIGGRGQVQQWLDVSGRWASQDDCSFGGWRLPTVPSVLLSLRAVFHSNPYCKKQMIHPPLWIGVFQSRHVTELKQYDFVTGLESVVLEAFLGGYLDAAKRTVGGGVRVMANRGDFSFIPISNLPNPLWSTRSTFVE